MDEVTAAVAAEAAAEGVRSLNHLTIGLPGSAQPGWEDLGDVYSVVGSLRALFDRLPQALEQVARAVEGSGVRYASDNDEKPAVLATRAVDQLRQAIANLAAVSTPVAAAHELISHLYVVERHLAVVVERHLAVVDDAGE